MSEEAWSELSVLESVIQDILDRTVHAFEANDLHAATKVEPMEQVVDDLVRSMRDRHIRRLQSGQCCIEAGFVLQDLLINYERIADHCSNIAVAMIEVAEDKFDVHEYVNTLRDANEKYDERYEKYGRRYVLPKADEGQVE